MKVFTSIMWVLFVLPFGLHCGVEALPVVLASPSGTSCLKDSDCNLSIGPGIFFCTNRTCTIKVTRANTVTGGTFAESNVLYKKSNSSQADPPQLVVTWDWGKILKHGIVFIAVILLCYACYQFMLVKTLGPWARQLIDDRIAPYVGRGGPRSLALLPVLFALAPLAAFAGRSDPREYIPI